MKNVPHKLCHAAVEGNVAARNLRDDLQARVSRLQERGRVGEPLTSVVRWQLASAGKPDPLPPGTHLFILRGSPRVCSAAFSDFERGDPLWFERGVVAWAPLPEVPAALTPNARKENAR